ncbi:hypothetical protein [Snodgrassella sp. CFCC 13594]|uniref:hypothetical protein n=1 Tax=Snodgrassella sp. CFCC 13594 TaxID=1775559 RepID=UPI000833F223|nr:hypothetical protein [Snodgrassella sp. CFCC 13594]
MATPIQTIEKPVLPPVSSELLVIYERPERPASGSPQHLLTHAVEYGGWCTKQDAQLRGWQSWYRQEQ